MSFQLEFTSFYCTGSTATPEKKSAVFGGLKAKITRKRTCTGKKQPRMSKNDKSEVI